MSEDTKTKSGPLGRKAKKKTEVKKSEEKKKEEIKRVPKDGSSIIISKDFSSIINVDELYGVGDDTNLIGTSRFKTIKTSDFLQKIISSMGMEIGENEILYPKGCRHIEKDVGNNYRLFVLEEEPCVRTISSNYKFNTTELVKKGLPKKEVTSLFKPSGEGDGVYSFRASFPYLIYLIMMQGSSFMGMKVFYRLSPLSSMSDYLLITNLLNLNENHDICMGSGSIPDRYKHNITEALDIIISSFWNSTFSPDYNRNVKIYEKEGYVGNYYNWAYHTKINPLFIYNINWIQHKRSLGQEIKQYMDKFSGRKSSSKNALTSFDSLVKSLSNKNKTTKPKESTTSSLQFYENIHESLYVPGACLMVGDEITFEEKRYNIYSFVATAGNQASFVNLLDQETKKIKQVKLSSENIEIFSKEYSKIKEFDSLVLPNKKKIKVDDIIKMAQTSNGPNGFYSIEKIRMGIDGNYEVYVGGIYYNANSLNLEVHNLDDIKFNGKKIKKGHEVYLHTADTYFNAIYPIKFARKYKFNRIIPDEYNTGRLLFEFIDGSGHSKKLPMSGEDNKIKILNIKNKDIEKNIGLFRIGFYIFDFDVFKEFFQGMYFDPETNEVTIIENPSYNGAMNHGRILSEPSSSSKRYANHEKIFKENGTQIFIPSSDMDIDFKIGDKIVIADWTTPERVGVLREITGFIYNGDRATIDIISCSLEGKNNSETRQDPYIYMNNGFIEFGKIRKVITKYRGYSVGDKIQATVKGIADFPMANFNTISAFIVDTGHEPMVLCSNAATLWFSQMEKEFKHIKKRTKAWLTGKNAPIRKYRNVFGNVVKDGNGHPGILMEASVTNLSYDPGPVLFYYLKDSYFRNREYNFTVSGSGSSIRPHGFQIPKLTDRQYIEETEGFKAYPNLLGGFFPSSKIYSPIIRLRKKK